jgi:hypothetical protein
MENRVQEYFESAAEQTSELVEAQPISAAAVAFGFGLVVGIASVALLAQQQTESKLAIAEREAARYGKQILDRLATMVPSFWKS